MNNFSTYLDHENERLERDYRMRLRWVTNEVERHKGIYSDEQVAMVVGLLQAVERPALVIPDWVTEADKAAHRGLYKPPNYKRILEDEISILLNIIKTQ